MTPQFKINPLKEAKLIKKMAELDILESDITESFAAASSKGGQKANKTSTKARVKHLPTGLEVTSNKTRSQSTNRFIARRELIEKIEAHLTGKPTAKEVKAEKAKKQKMRRKRRSSSGS